MSDFGQNSNSLSNLYSGIGNGLYEPNLRRYFQETQTRPALLTEDEARAREDRLIRELYESGGCACAQCAESARAAITKRDAASLSYADFADFDRSG